MRFPQQVAHLFYIVIFMSDKEATDLKFAERLYTVSYHNCGDF